MNPKKIDGKTMHNNFADNLKKNKNVESVKLWLVLRNVNCYVEMTSFAVATISPNRLKHFSSTNGTNVSCPCLLIGLTRGEERDRMRFLSFGKTGKVEGKRASELIFLTITRDDTQTRVIGFFIFVSLQHMLSLHALSHTLPLGMHWPRTRRLKYENEMKKGIAVLRETTLLTAVQRRVNASNFTTHLKRSSLWWQ